MLSVSPWLLKLSVHHWLPAASVFPLLTPCSLTASASVLNRVSTLLLTQPHAPGGTVLLWCFLTCTVKGWSCLECIFTFILCFRFIRVEQFEALAWRRSCLQISLCRSCIKCCSPQIVSHCGSALIMLSFMYLKHPADGLFSKQSSETALPPD